jgi:hypothetical protein
MKITKSYLKQLIKEELELSEIERVPTQGPKEIVLNALTRALTGLTTEQQNQLCEELIKNLQELINKNRNYDK